MVIKIDCAHCKLVIQHVPKINPLHRTNIILNAKKKLKNYI